MGKLASLLVGLVGLLSFVYVAFFVPIGTATLYEHLKRIAATEPARELGAGLESTGRQLGAKVEGALSREDGP